MLHAYRSQAQVDYVQSPTHDNFPISGKVMREQEQAWETSFRCRDSLTLAITISLPVETRLLL